nr:MAG TPA_asm: hypothetical protein [Bacteriophage sp.]
MFYNIIEILFCILTKKCINSFCIWLILNLK